jgi:4-aminobutyrate aminotransferase/(S)-3-amino-2-methylpropionate transaminase
MLAIDLVEDRETKRPAVELATVVVAEAAKRGLLLLKAGTYSNCIRVLCPLTLSDEQLEEALSAWEEALEAALGA